MYWNPLLTSPTTYSSGTNTSSRKTSLVRSSPIVQIGRIVMPGWSSGTSISVMPWCLFSGSVRVPSQYHSAKCADVVHVFWPLSRQPSPSRSAFRRIDAASEPALGSLYPTANSTSFFRIIGRNFCLRKSLPCAMSVLPMMPTPLPICGPPRAASASFRMNS